VGRAVIAILIFYGELELSPSLLATYAIQIIIHALFAMESENSFIIFISQFSFSAPGIVGERKK
jgi:hypothetical protein